MDVKCLICEKKLEKQEDDFEMPVDNGGWMQIAFGYGSKYDQIGIVGLDPIRDLLSCDIVQAYICDDCFRVKFSLCEGYNKSKTYERII